MSLKQRCRLFLSQFQRESVTMKTAWIIFSVFSVTQRRIYDPIKYQRWSFLQKYLTTISLYPFSHKSPIADA